MTKPAELSAFGVVEGESSDSRSAVANPRADFSPAVPAAAGGAVKAKLAVTAPKPYRVFGQERGGKLLVGADILAVYPEDNIAFF